MRGRSQECHKRADRNVALAGSHGKIRKAKTGIVIAGQMIELGKRMDGIRSPRERDKYHKGNLLKAHT